MRLSRPNFASEPSFFVEQPDFAYSTFQQNDPHSVFAENRLETFEISELLRLPQSFGNIFLGENFSCYICVNNESQTIVKDVAIKVELQV